MRSPRTSNPASSNQAAPGRPFNSASTTAVCQSPLVPAGANRMKPDLTGLNQSNPGRVGDAGTSLPRNLPGRDPASPTPQTLPLNPLFTSPQHRLFAPWRRPVFAHTSVLLPTKLDSIRRTRPHRNRRTLSHSGFWQGEHGQPQAVQHRGRDILANWINR